MKVRTTVAGRAWASAFLDGEGCFLMKRGKYPTVSASQKDPELLYRLQALYGGSVRYSSCGRGKKIWYWAAYGNKAISCVKEIFGWLSKKRTRECLPILQEGQRRGLFQ